MRSEPMVTCRECGKQVGFELVRPNTHRRKRGAGYCEGVRYVLRWEERVQAYVSAGWTLEDAEEAADLDDRRARDLGAHRGGPLVACPVCGERVSFMRDTYFHFVQGDDQYCAGSGQPVSRDDRVQAFEEEGWSRTEAEQTVDEADAPSDVWFVHFAFEVLRDPSEPVHADRLWDRDEVPTFEEVDVVDVLVGLAEQLDASAGGEPYWLPLVPADLYIGEDRFDEIDHLTAANANWGDDSEDRNADFIYEPDLWVRLSGMTPTWGHVDSPGILAAPSVLPDDVSVDVRETWRNAQGDHPQPLEVFGVTMEQVRDFDVEFLTPEFRAGWHAMVTRMQNRAELLSTGPVRVWWWFVPVQA